MSPSRPAAARPAQPRLGLRGGLRFLWRQLTSMRTALLLLLLLALAAIPGALWPQRSIDQAKVTEYLQAHPALGPWLDRLQLFDVYTSAWFSAIYLLLVVSLIGCIVPRTAQHVAALRAQPPRTPARPERLDDHRVVHTSASAAQAEAAARAVLSGRRYRVRRPDPEPAPGATPDPRAGGVSAERGHLRESGNLLFHVAVVAVVVALAAGYLVGWRADKIVPVGETFVNAHGEYHTFAPGPLVDVDALQPFSVRIDDVAVRFEEQPGHNQLGAPRDFRVSTTTRDAPDAPQRRQVLSVNGPLHFDGAEVYLLGNGYAPRVTVRDGAGRVLYSQATPFLPQDARYRSTGAIKVPAAAPDALGFSGLFLPTAYDGDDGPASAFPDLRSPALVLTAYEGDLFGADRSPSVYRLDTEGMRQLKDAAGKPLRIWLEPGKTVTLPGGRGSITLDGVDRWAGVSTRYDPVKGAALWSSLAMLLGLVLSLVVPRRRVFARARPRSEGGSRLVVAAIAQREDTNLPDVLDDLAAAIAGRLPGATIIGASSPGPANADADADASPLDAHETTPYRRRGEET